MCDETTRNSKTWLLRDRTPRDNSAKRSITPPALLALYLITSINDDLSAPYPIQEF